MKEKERLIQELDAARAEMHAVVSACNADRELYPGWTIQQVLAHITGWDDVTTAVLRAHAQGKDIGTPVSRGIDHYNAQSVATREGLDYRQVVAEWEQARDALKAAINDLPPEKFKENFLFPWGQTGSAARIVGIMIHHEREHAEEIHTLITGAVEG